MEPESLQSGWSTTLCCPACLGSLRAAATDRIECVECAAGYPVFDGIPWLYRDVAGSRAQWAAKLQQFRTDLLADHAALEVAAGSTDLLPATRERLRLRTAGLAGFGQQVFELLEPFAFAHGEAGSALPRERIPSQQHVTSYLETVFRDWCWGGEELDRTLAMLDPLLPEASPDRNVLLLGGGGGRLAYEIAARGEWSSVVQLDLNPLLTRVAKRVAGGESVALTELPEIPLGLAHVAVEQTLARPAGHHPATTPEFVLGDAFAPPFAPGAFDLLLTPWFVDILPESFRGLSARLGRLVADDALWVSFGPLSFESLAPGERLVAEEMTQALEDAGFEVEHAETRCVPYLHSPHGMARRSEEIFVFAARRRAAIAPVEEFAFYPTWLTDGTQSVPADAAFERMRAERVFELEILKCIDGKRGLEDIVGLLSERYGLDPDRCRNTVNRFFSRLVEQDGLGRR